MGYGEFQRWRLLRTIAPWGPERADMHAAHVVATLINLHQGREATPVSVADVLLEFDPVGAAERELARAERDADLLITKLERWLGPIADDCAE